MGRTTSTALLVALAAHLGSALGAQHGAEPDPKGFDHPPLHRPITRIDPDLAFRHLRMGSVRWEAARKAGTDPTRLPPRERPSQGSRFLATVFASSELPFEPHELLGVPAHDLYLISTPGPIVRQPEVALAEILEAQLDVSLAVILVHERCLALKDPGPDRVRSAATEHLARIVERAQREADRLQVSRAMGHALVQKQTLFDGSVPLRKAHRKLRFGVAIGVVDDVTGAIEWHAPDLRGWPIQTGETEERPTPPGPTPSGR